jgi:hypothetical protein
MATMIRTFASIAGTSASSGRDPLRTAITADVVWDTDPLVASAQRSRAGWVPLDDRPLGDAAIAVAAPRCEMWKPPRISCDAGDPETRHTDPLEPLIWFPAVGENYHPCHSRRVCAARGPGPCGHAAVRLLDPQVPGGWTACRFAHTPPCDIDELVHNVRSKLTTAARLSTPPNGRRGWEFVTQLAAAWPARNCSTSGRPHSRSAVDGCARAEIDCCWQT